MLDLSPRGEVTFNPRRPAAAARVALQEKAAARSSMTALRFFRLASAAISSRSTAAVESRSSHRPIGKSGRGARLRAKARADCARGPSRPIHVERQPKHEARRPALPGEGEQARRIGRKTLRRDRLHPGREAPLGIARGDADRLGAEIEPDQRAALRQEHGYPGERNDRERACPRLPCASPRREPIDGRACRRLCSARIFRASARRAAAAFSPEDISHVHHLYRPLRVPPRL